MVKDAWINWALVIAFLVRVYFSTQSYNPDIWNHQAWMQSVTQEGWRGLYERDMGERAKVNYPPLTLYSFYVSEKMYQQLPHQWQSENTRAAFYKLPSLIADMVIAWLIWKLLPGSKKVKVITAGIFLLNPALWYNSVTWGQIESLSALTAMLGVIALVKRRVDLLVLSAGIALLTKQNVLPILPLLLLGLGYIKPNWKKVGAALLLIAGIGLVAYAPLIPNGKQAITYVVETYLTAIGGQAHQHYATVNALNFWYAGGMNNVPDSTQVVGGINVRTIGVGLTILGLAIATFILIKGTKSWYQRCWRAVSVITLWTFLFATRMHERHSYMAIAYLTWLYPNIKNKWIYWVISLISWVNVWAVWQGYFWLIVPNKWDDAGRILSTIMVGLTLGLVLELFHQESVKTKIVDGG